jgi:hypothetical protein
MFTGLRRWLYYRRRFSAALREHLDGGYRVSPHTYDGLRSDARRSARERYPQPL